MDPEQKEIEQQKLEIERQKLRAEHRKTTWTNVSILTSVLVAGATISFSMWNVRSAAQSQLQSEAVKLMFAGEDTGSAVGKGQAMVRLLSGSLPPGLEKKLQDPGWLKAFFTDFPKRDPRYDQKLELIKLLAANTNNQSQIVKIWRRMFPQDEWVEEALRTAVVSGSRPR